MSEMLHEVAGVIPREVVVMNDQEAVMESEEEKSIMEVLKQFMGYFIRADSPLV